MTPGFGSKRHKNSCVHINLNKKRSKKGGIEGWSKPEESPVLSEAQIERRKRLQQRHDFEKIWSQEKKIFKNNNNKIMKKKVEGNVLAINDDGEAKEEPENVQEGKEKKSSGSNREVKGRKIDTKEEESV